MSTRHVRILPALRSRARGLFLILRSLGYAAKVAYHATVATYGRTLLRAYYWDSLPTHARRVVTGLALA